MRWLISIPLLLLLCGCTDAGYYWHSTTGHLDIMNERVDIDEMLADDDLDSKLRARLLLVQEIRQFSIDRLGLPDNGSYSSYVNLQQPYVIQNLFAAPELSIRLHQWCYPVIGCQLSGLLRRSPSTGLRRKTAVRWSGSLYWPGAGLFNTGLVR